MKECYKPKTSDEIQKASEEYIFKTNIDDANVQDHFIAGAEWMLDNPTGGALLYAVEKTAERTKREVIKEAAEWLSNNMFNSINNGVIINGYCVSDFIGRFKKAMQDESK